MNGFLLDALGIALITLRYGGLVTIIGGGILWAISKNSTEKNKRGIWMLYTGGFMLIFHFGWHTVVSLISFFVEVGVK